MRGIDTWGGGVCGISNIDGQDAANGPTAVPASTLVYEQVGGVAAGAAGLSLELASGREVALAEVRMLR